MENTVRCDGCNVELEIDKIAFQEYDEQNTAWYYCEKCKEYLNTRGDKTSIAPKEEGYFCATAGPGRMRNVREVIQELIEKNEEEIIECDYCGIALPKKDSVFYRLDEENLFCHYCKICDNTLQKHVEFVKRNLENKEQNLENEEHVREFNEVISYFKTQIERHGIVARIISDNIDHKYFMDELNNTINSRNSNCIMVLHNRIWICTSKNDLVKLVFIDDRTTMKDLTTEVKSRIIGILQESEMANMRLRHEKELDLLRGINRVEHPAPTAASIPQPPVSNRSRRL